MSVTRPLPSPGDKNWGGPLNQFLEELRESHNTVEATVDGLVPQFPAVQQAAIRAEQSKLAAEAAAVTARTARDIILAPTDEQVADLATTPGTETNAALNSTFVGFDVKPGDSNAEFIAAATAAKAAGRNILRAAPGSYTVPGIHPDDIQGLYLVGDGVTLTGTPVPNLYPFSTDEFAGTTARATSGVTGRGVVAFEVDDGLPIHWDHLFPLCKELGITMGTGWHTDNGARWITEAHRHGWEIVSHMPYDADWTASTLADVEAAAVSSLAAIEGAIGTREGIGFIYPRHLRTAEMDAVLSKYYTRGRGLPDVQSYPRGAGHRWLVSAYFADPHLQGTVSETLKSVLRSVSAQDGQIVLYIHFDSATAADRTAGLRELIPFIRSLGMDIRNPGQVWGGTNVMPDPYNENDTWTVSAGAAKVTNDGYKGNRSVKFTTVNATSVMGIGHVTPRPGMFTVMRLSNRIKTTGFTTSSAAWGLSCVVTERRRKLDGGTAFPPSVALSRHFPASGSNQGALDWGAARRLLYLQPSTPSVQITLSSANVTSGEYLVGEGRLDLVGYVSTIEYTVTLNGTTGVTAPTDVPSLSRCGVVLQPLAPVAGALTYTVTGAAVEVVSSDPGDVGMQVRIILTPGPPYDSMVPDSTGA